MNRFFKLLTVFLILFLLQNAPLLAQKKIEQQLSDSITAIVNRYVNVGRLDGTSLKINDELKKIRINFPDKTAYIPFRNENVKYILQVAKQILQFKYPDYSINCFVENKDINELIPYYFLSDSAHATNRFTFFHTNKPLTTNISQPYKAYNGLNNRHIAIWNSHGRYYNQRKSEWEWQRPCLMQTVEDLFTRSFVIPFLVPMLENAGACVLLPRERDTQTNEVIVDEDNKTDSKYIEHNKLEKWNKSNDVGFAMPKTPIITTENPFLLGTSRMAQSVTDKEQASTAEWIPSLIESGKYAVYVSYRSYPNSIKDACYSVIHKGIKTKFTVNQQMGGGTWIYLGQFDFDKDNNKQNKVTLSNLSETENAIVSADAVRFGGGMGNVSRFSNPNDTIIAQKTDTTQTPIVVPKKNEPSISRLPRYAEGARYWLQWAGMPDSVYSRTKGKNDYSDDFQSRGYWVNYLSGGSVVLSQRKGLNIPIDMAFALHSDAGIAGKDSIVGTLGICSVTKEGKQRFENNDSRWASRDLVDMVTTQILNDTKKQIAPEWNSRGMWNKSYSESRVPEVPSMILEILSHQNFTDMCYGLDPRFRFVISRAIYKGILKFLATSSQDLYTVQPLPISNFHCRFLNENQLELSWKANIDSLEFSATPDRYILYTQIDDRDFDNGTLLSTNHAIVSLKRDKIYRFKVTAVNDGGQSFPSETLSACRVGNEKGLVMIVNSFERISAPYNYKRDTIYAGFDNNTDPGMPYIADNSFVGKQYAFDKRILYKNDNEPGFGASYSDWNGQEIAGNTFDYPSIHGSSIQAAGYSFVSSNIQAILSNEVNLEDYKYTDIIFGEQKQTYIGNGRLPAQFKVFPKILQNIITKYCHSGGNLLISGSHIASDTTLNDSQTTDASFCDKILHYKCGISTKNYNKIRLIPSSIISLEKDTFDIYTDPNPISYHVYKPDVIQPTSENSCLICSFNDKNSGSGVAYLGNYNVCSLSFPFETIKDEKKRNILMNEILYFLSQKKMNKSESRKD